MISSVVGGVARAATGAGVDARGVRGTLEHALPGEWAALVMIFAVIAVVAVVILVATCLGHERTIARRRARRPARGSTRSMA